MLSNEKIIYRNIYGEQFDISYDGDLIPVSLDEDVANSLNTSSYALQDGSTLVSSNLKERNITVKFTYAIKKAQEIERNVVRVCDPRIGAELIKVSNGQQKHISVVPKAVPEINRMTGRGEITLELCACYPFYSLDEVYEYLTKVRNAHIFPIHWTDETDGKIFAEIMTDTVANVTNAGDTSTGFVVIMRATNEVVNPSFNELMSGKRIAFNVTMEKGDEITIINEPYSKAVYMNGVKRFDILDRTKTEFFDMHVGRNTFGIEADTNVSELSAYISYSPKFLY